MKQIQKNTYSIEKESGMQVPVQVYANEHILPTIQTALTQAKNVASLPGIQTPCVLLQDAHQGYGFPIGCVGAFDAKTGIVSPGGIGFDINCGVRLIATTLTKEQVLPKMQEILESIYQKVPVGQGGKGFFRLSLQELDEVLEQGLFWAHKKGYASQDDLERCENSGKLPASASAVPLKAKQRGMHQLATLGAGNHFIELQVVEDIFDKEIAKTFGITQPNQIVVMIHSGSRGIGHQTCAHYLREMEKAYPDIVQTLQEKDLIYAPLSDTLAQDYLQAMNACANFAWVNRFLMGYQVKQVLKSFFPDCHIQSVYDVAHNIAKFETHTVLNETKTVLVHRKGATRAFPAHHQDLPDCYKQTGHPVLIPGSMGTPSFVLVGTQKAMEQTFGSTAHGAGRIMSRVKAFKEFDGLTISKQLEEKGIFIKSPNNAKIADESPGAYKDSLQVIDVSVQANIAKKIVQLCPFGVIKG
ncbi:MAG: RtcB family protein [Candidatus Woesearchaeota archaeon]